MKISRNQFFVCIILVQWVFFASLMAQRDPMKFGSIDNDDLYLSECPIDKEAGAMVLGDYGVSRIVYLNNIGFVIEHTRHLRMKIFKQSEVDRGNLVEYLYKSDNKRETIRRIRGFTYNLEDGKVRRVKLSKDAIFEEETGPYQIAVKMSMPQIKEGSVFEIEYSVQSEFLFNLPEWEFQYDIPALFSEYRVYIPEYFNYKQLMKGYLRFDVAERKSERTQIHFTVKSYEHGLVGRPRTDQYKEDCRLDINRWRIDNVPAFIREPHISSAKNYISAVEFELSTIKYPYSMIQNITSTWEKINEELMKLKDFGLQLNRSGFLRDDVVNLSQLHNNEFDKMVGAFEFIRDHMEWNRYNSVYTNNNLRVAYNNKKGNSAEINLMLVLLLRELGLEANPVILSTRNNGMLHPGQIMIGKFNYVIATVNIDNNTYLLDATEKRAPYYLLPERCLNGKGRIISEKFTDWIDLSTDYHDRTRTMVNLMMDSVGKIAGTIIVSNEHYSALNIRNYLATVASQDEVIKEFEASNQHLKIVDYSFENLDSIDAPFIEKYTVELVNEMENIPENIYLNPILVGRQKENQYKLEDRQYPVDRAYPLHRQYIFNLILAEGFAADEMPSGAVHRMENNDAEFIYRIGGQGNIIQCMYDYKVNKSIFLPNEYKHLKEFYELIVAKQAENLVIANKTF